MASVGIVDKNGKFTPEFAAYTKLTLVNRFVKKQIWGQNVSNHTPMSFTDFLDAIKNKAIVHDHYARSVTSYEIRNSEVNARRNGDAYFEKQKFNAILKAYELGLVDHHGILLSEV